ncbi:FAD-containing oxidoreductase [uncultured Agrobacterium sp.]|uniref:FAD-containing oxidoreductase n=1 Tax=uncultured Agrobacterium sp. TaxID=157277 RepID=UPI0025F7D3BC|nr:FAD-containing oxidoreductase [uncultured Agrobacterium sp.]
MREYDAIFIGAGQSGPFLAARMAAMGRKVILIERKYLGGTCVNAGCMPTKALVASAKTVEVARRASEFGVTINGEPKVHMPAIAARARKVTLDARNGLASWFDSLETMDVLHAQARFTGKKTVTVGETCYTAPQIFINVGARPHIPDIPGLKDVPYLTSTSVIALEELPRHLVVLGGSYIGLEFAQMYRRFGAEVTVIERGQQLAPREDADISDAIANILSGDGIKVLMNHNLLSVTKEEAGAVIRTDQGEVRGSHVLVALGRRPNTDDLGLDLAGIETDRRGFITVDERLQTTAEGVWALGDCNGRGAFTHTSYNDFEIVAANLLDGGNRKVSDRILSYGLYIDPPLGRAGMTESQAKEAGHRIKVSTRPMSRVGRAVEKGETLGLLKLVVDADTDRILGAAFLGVGGDEAIYGVLDAINLGATTEELRWAVPIHPTVGELVPTLIGDLPET